MDIFCNKCGRILKPQEGKDTVYCEYCNIEQPVYTDAPKKSFSLKKEEAPTESKINLFKKEEAPAESKISLFKKEEAPTESKTLFKKEEYEEEKPENDEIERLFKRIEIFLHDYQWDKADEYAERVLDIDPENANAYVYKMLAEYKEWRLDSLLRDHNDVHNNKNFTNALNYADGELAEQLLEYQTRQIENYKRYCAKYPLFKRKAEIIKEYKDACNERDYFASRDHYIKKRVFAFIGAGWAAFGVLMFLILSGISLFTAAATALPFLIIGLIFLCIGMGLHGQSMQASKEIRLALIAADNKCKKLKPDYDRVVSIPDYNPNTKY